MSQTFHKLFDISAYVFIANGFYWLLSQNNTITKWFNQWLALIGQLHFGIHIVMMFIAGMVIYNLMASTNCYPKNHGLTAPEHLKIYKLSNALVAGIISVILWATVLPLPVNSIATTLVNTFATMAGFCFGSWAFVRMMFERPKTNKCDTSHQPITNTAQDKYDRSSVVTQIYDALTNCIRHISLHGDYGSGKSSVLNLVEEKLIASGQQWLIVRFNAWGRLTEDITIQSLVLKEINIALADIFATANLNEIPNSYIAALGEVHKSAKMLSHLLTNNTSTQELLAKLNTQLSVYDIKLCIYLEDLDRDREADDKLNELAPLLDSFNEYDNVHFIFALGYRQGLSAISQRITQLRIDLPPIDFSSEIKNLIEEHLDISQKAGNRIFRNTHSHGSQSYNKVNRHPIYLTYGFKIPKFKQSTDSKKDSNSLPSEHGYVFDSLCNIINFPRQFITIEKETTLLWQYLAGHFDFDCLLILTTLKTCEPIAFDFINQHRESLKGNLGDFEGKRSTVLSQKWTEDKMEEQLNYPLAAGILVHYLFPSNQMMQQAKFGLIQTISYSNTHKDYWQLYLHPSKVNDASHISDQEVLKTITLNKNETLESLNETQLNFIDKINETEGLALHLNNLARCLKENADIHFNTLLFEQLFHISYTAYINDNGRVDHDRYYRFLTIYYELARDFLEAPAKSSFIEKVIKENLFNDLYFIHTSRNSYEEFKSDQITLALSKHIDSPIIKQQLISQNERYRGWLFNLLGFYSAKPIGPKQNRLQHKIYTWLIEIGNSLPLESSDTVNRSIYFFDMVHYSDGHSYCINDEIINQPAFETDMMKQILEWATDFADKDNKQTRTQKLIKLIEKREKDAQNLT